MALRHLIVCASCGSRFEANRSDASTCSGRCRARLSRTRRAEVTVAEVARAADVLAALRAAAEVLPPD